jgi:multiple sugar transport system substrate-binding protein
MATIKDIAKVAGVSQGTVSNVLNGKGNVSSDKMLRVEAAAHSLGYTANEKAKMLRKGSSNIIALIIPNPQDRHYVDFQISFTAFIEAQGYESVVYYSEDNAERERSLVEQIKASMAPGLACFSSVGAEAYKMYQELGFDPANVLFIERKGGPLWIGFDYAKAAADIAAYLRQCEVDSMCVVTEEKADNDETFVQVLREQYPSLTHIRTNLFNRKSKLFSLHENQPPACVVTTHSGLARVWKNIQQSFFPETPSRLITLSTLNTLPEEDFERYELNYRYLGRKAAEQLLNALSSHQTSACVLPNNGFRTWSKSRMEPCLLRVLLLATPHSSALQHFAQKFSRETGVAISVEIASYERINEVLVSETLASEYDILRIGADVFSWDAPKVLRPLDEIPYSVDSVFANLVEGVEQPYTHVMGKRYAIPISPSLQVLFYRKDLFDKPMYRRIYQETYHETLKVPTTFEQYNRIAGFFSNAVNPASPILYGSTLLLGKKPVVAGTEFMTRYFSYAPSLFEEGLPRLISDEAERAMQDILSLRHSISSPQTWWTEAAQEFANGKTAMTILFSNFASEFFGKNSQVSDKIGYSMVPGCRPLLGGGSLGVTRACRHPEQALRFIAWMASEPVASAVALFGGNPITASTLTNYEVIEAFPWMEMLSTGFTQALGQRTPSTNCAPFNDHKFVNLLGEAVWRCWYEQVPIKKSLQRAQQVYERERESFIR